MDGFVLDAYSDPARGEVVVWLKTKDGAARLAERFAPVVHVRSRDEAALRALRDALGAVRGVGAMELREALCGLEERPSRVLSVAVEDHRLVGRLAQMVDARGAYRDFEVFDADLRLAHRYFLARGVWPLARVRAFAPGRFRLLEPDRRSFDYPWPDLRTLEVKARPACAPGELPTHATPLASVEVGPGCGLDAAEALAQADEAGMLRWLAARVAALDPDVVVTDGGDTFLLPYLRARAEACGVEFHLGREPDPARPRRGGKSFFTYGKIKWQAPAWALHGRVHLDRSTSFFYTEAGLHGLVDLARMSNVPLQELARLGAGTALTAIQIDLAAARGRLIPWKKNVPEAFKTARQLLAADRGGYIFEPRVGLHEDVVELDFASLYPNLMVRHNISPETVACGCCRPDELPRERVTPQLDSWTCGKRDGFIPAYLRPILDRREHFKRQRKADPANRRRHQEICDVYKWLLVTSFGYQGYKNAKFGRIECHEAIGAWGRETLLSALEIARDEGFELVHGIVDSLWLKRVGFNGERAKRPASDGVPAGTESLARRYLSADGVPAGTESLARRCLSADGVPAGTESLARRYLSADGRALEERVSRELGIRFEYQGRYKWIVFLPTRRHGGEVGALNRYYGCFDAPPDKPSRSQAGQPLDYLAGGALKVRGVEMRQHSTPRVVREAQERFLAVVAEADDARGFLELLPAAVQATRPVLRRVLDGACDLRDLVVTQAVSREADEYRALTRASAAVRQLARRGVAVPPGDVVRYVVTDGAARDAERKVVEARLLRGDEAYDRAAYAALVLRAVASLTLPFGLDEARLADALGEARQAPLAAYAQP